MDVQQVRAFAAAHYCPDVTPADVAQLTTQQLTFHRELAHRGPAVQYAVLLDGVVIGHVYGWDGTRPGTGRFPHRTVRERTWHSGTATPWHTTRHGAALDTLIRHLGHRTTY